MFVGVVVGVDVWEVVGYRLVVVGGNMRFQMMVEYCQHKDFGILLNWQEIERQVCVGQGYICV